MGDVNELKKEKNKTMANLPGSIKNLNTLLGEQLLEGGGSGGGGSSDFSTAEVTNSEDSEESITLMCVINEIGPNMETPTEGSIRAGRTKTAVLYKGHQYVALDPVKVVTVSSGNAEIITVTDPMSGDMNFLDIKGDCTLLVAIAE